MNDLQTVTGATYGPMTALEVPMRNGDSFYFINSLTLGDALVASSVFLLLAFLVTQWLLNSVWRRR